MAHPLLLVGVSGYEGEQVAHPDQVVGSSCKSESPTDSGDATVTSLAQPADGLEPAEDLFHPLAPPLAESITGVAGGAAIDRAVGLLRDMRGNAMLAEFQDEFFLIVTLVGTQRDPAPAGDLFHHRQGRLGLGATAGLSQAGVDHQAVTIVHLHVARVAELGLFARPFACQTRFRIGGRLVSGVTAPLAVK